MKKRILILLLTLTFQLSFAQDGEFEIQENGLIYGESTMTKLKTIVDSLNLKFKVCDIDKRFNSNYQIFGHKVKLYKKKVKEAKIDIENNISLEEFQKKYPKAIITKNILIVRYDYKNIEGEDVVDFNEVNVNNRFNFELRFWGEPEKYKVENLSNWLFKHNEKTTYSEESISAFYFPSKMESKELPKSYSQMISYSDCLIDTTTTKFKKGADYGWHEGLPEDWKKQSIENQEKLLNTLRNTRVMGGCSADDSPRRHAVNIAMVSAETYKWEIFLKAHLDVMNDSFERFSDASYAWGQRKTYIKELEELNINVLDLIIGISLQINNPSENHYFGKIRRIGRALSETKNKEEVESQLFTMIEDGELDLYNRVMMYYIVVNYIHNQTEEAEKNRLNKRLKKSIKGLPKEII
ncbi:hypothetical protein [Flammeovirga sp. SJP92]|uniref:hypothetical protein n=1 Tax=Flammeovirga sp. SJP92 TaxID=1775430 RepID=UPI000789A5CA|nr:hypothetical protein [Flammeovirga sp. SJP92]KXX70635.1 hypothetical protein AVL50_07380 [Flammeovirga sp. SJP92]